MNDTPRLVRSQIELVIYHLDFPTHNQAMPIGIDKATGEVYVPVIFFPMAEHGVLRRGESLREPILKASEVLLCRADFVLAQKDIKESVRRAVNKLVDLAQRHYQMDSALDPADPAVPLTPDELRGAWIKH